MRSWEVGKDGLCVGTEILGLIFNKIDPTKMPIVTDRFLV